MAAKGQVRKVIKTINSDPELLDQLLAARSDDERKEILVKRGVLKEGEHGPRREEAEQELNELVAPLTKGKEDDLERPVEWVAAIGTAAAGAAAAFCAAE